MKINRLFPLQLWLMTVIVVAPIIIIITNAIKESGFFKHPENIKFILALIVFGLFFSLPVFIISIISYKILLQKKLSSFQIKIILILICIIGVVVTFLIASRDFLVGTSYYSISIVISSLFIRIYNTDKLKNSK